MGRERLDKTLLNKLKNNTGKSEKYLREQISKKANRLGISSEAYLVIWAKQLGIGTSIYQRKLSPSIQTEIRDVLPTIFAPRYKPTTEKSKKMKRGRQKSPLLLAIEYLVKDKELLDRCKDLIKAPRNYDRVFREATTVLENRIRNLSGISGMKPSNLVSKAINPEPDKAILKISVEASEQEGFHNICKGLMLSFRDPIHHEISDKFQREDALKFCGFVDSILAILNKAKKQN